ncbi:ABC transporter permease subunit [Lactobacillus corticis]|uniref:Nitrate/sulfonate/bicarbonate ABC transporter permease protein n=1 Tax=Lactobacillus corticis TaxID=2201249 RepID=A0A916QIK3_9LACO|nr:ABC transporter permease subunit [Lactobacillus corticis]GFZ27023.1 nitrate/sulfonate/bicarbonate ABC transporter permease protein [Lactobacillus corticis]
MTKSTFKKKFLPWLLPIVIILFWQLAVQLKWIQSEFLPAPTEVVQTAIVDWKKGILQKNISISLFRATCGFVIGGGMGFILGLLSGTSKLFRKTFDSTIQMLRTIPNMALIPLVVLILGIGEPAKICFVALACLFPMYINTYHGITSIDPDLLEMGKSYQLNTVQMFKQIIFPGALPTILMGVRYALGTMWTALIVAETVSADSGIGYMSTNAQQYVDVKTIYLCIIIYAFLGELSNYIAKNLETIFLEWRNSARSLTEE